MKTLLFWCAVFLCLATARAATPTFTDFDKEYFKTNGFKVSIALPTNAHEIWISGVSNMPGTGIIRGLGTPMAPYYGDFNAICLAQSTNTVFHFYAGTNLLIGWSGRVNEPSFVFRSGWQWIGAGIEKSWLVVTNLPNVYPGQSNAFTSEMVALETDNSVLDHDFSLSGFSIDVGTPITNVTKRMGIRFYGHDFEVSDVAVWNTIGFLFPAETPIGSPDGLENFAISLHGFNFSITRCQVPQFSQSITFPGSYNDDLGISGTNFLCSENVFAAPGTPGVINFGGSVRATFRDNTINGSGTAGFYADTDPVFNTTWIGNTVTNCKWGILCLRGRTNDDTRNLTFQNNTILFSRISGNPSQGISLGPSTPPLPHISGISVVGNTIGYGDGGPSTNGIDVGIGFGAYGSTNSGMKGVYVSQNHLERTLDNHHLYAVSDIVEENNFDLMGVSLDVRVVSATNAASSVTLDQPERFLFNYSTNLTTVYLPTAFGFSGRVITVNSAAGPLTVNPFPGGDVIVGTSTGISNATFLCDGLSTYAVGGGGGGGASVNGQDISPNSAIVSGAIPAPYGGGVIGLGVVGAATNLPAAFLLQTKDGITKTVIEQFPLGEFAVYISTNSGSNFIRAFSVNPISHVITFDGPGVWSGSNYMPTLAVSNMLFSGSWNVDSLRVTNGITASNITLTNRGGGWNVTMTNWDGDTVGDVMRAGPYVWLRQLETNSGTLQFVSSTNNFSTHTNRFSFNPSTGAFALNSGNLYVPGGGRYGLEHWGECPSAWNDSPWNHEHLYSQMS